MEIIEEQPQPAQLREIPVSAHNAHALLRPVEEGDSLLYRRTARVDLACNVMFAAVAVFGIVGVAVWHLVNAPVTTPAPVVPMMRAAVAAAPSLPAAAPQALVHVTNPFDAAETFAFPAGTSQSQAHEATAELLLQRARTRLAQRVRYASLPEQARTAAREPNEILVTRLNGESN